MQNEKKPKGYFQGKFFDSIDEMFGYAACWEMEDVSKQDLEMFCNHLCENIWFNIEMNVLKLKNHEAFVLFEEILMKIISDATRKNNLTSTKIDRIIDEVDKN